MGVPSQTKSSTSTACGKGNGSKQQNSRRKPKATDGKEVIRLITHDMIRDIVVPAAEPNVYPAVMENSEYERLKNQAKVITMRERLKTMEEMDTKKNQQIQECVNRKEAMQKWEKRREKGTKLKDIEIDACRRATHILQRAYDLRQEQEDEIKKANQLIMSTKCHAIRVAQIAEKKLIQKELEAEEHRLDQMMEQERRRALQDEEVRKERQEAKKQQFVNQITEQIKENEIEKILEAERIEEESRQMSEAALQVQLDDMEQIRKQQAQKELTKKELRDINDQLKYFQEMEREEGRIADLKVQEFMRQKAEREAAREKEQLEIRMAKEREIARLRALQQRQQDVQAQMDEMNAQRTQDEVEREWRRKEKEAAIKKVKDDDALKEARARQVLDQRRMQALEIAREKREFDRIIKVQQEAAEKEKLQELRRQNEMERHREAIQKQINEKERERIKGRQQLFEEGQAIRLEHEQREQNVKKSLLKKMADLRVHRVPEVYVKEIERQLKIGNEEATSATNNV